MNSKSYRDTPVDCQIHREQTIKPTVGELAAAFSSMSSDEMAAFFSEVAWHVGKWDQGIVSFCIKMQRVTDDPVLSGEGRGLMAVIGEYSSSEVKDSE